MERLVIASPHRYADLCRLWHRWVMRDVVPAFMRAGLDVHVKILRDTNAEQFTSDLFPGVTFLDNGPGMRDHNEFCDGALDIDCDFLFFLDSDAFFFDAEWAVRHFKAFEDSNVAAVSLVPRNGRPAVFATVCRITTYRDLPPPVFACRYEFPKDWPGGVGLENGDAATRELIKRGKTIVNVGMDESSEHIANFRSSTMMRTTREFFTRAAGKEAFDEFVAGHRAFVVPAHDNVLLGCLYEAIFGEPFAPDAAGTPLGGSVTLANLRKAVENIRDARDVGRLRERFQRSRRATVRMAAREGVNVEIPWVLPDENIAQGGQTSPGKFNATAT